MIDGGKKPAGWRIGGDVILCAAHAEGRFGASLYREAVRADVSLVEYALDCVGREPLRREEDLRDAGGCGVCKHDNKPDIVLGWWAARRQGWRPE